MSLVRALKQMIVATAFVAVGCGNGGTTGVGGSGTGGAGDAGTDGPDFCGQCAPGPADGWDNPVLLWIGAEKDAPSCPIDAPRLAFEGYADLDAPTNCGSCSCSVPTGSCNLPTTVTANAATCALNGGSTPHTPFDPSTGWDGSCDANTSIASGKLCSGVKCVQSVTIGPLSMSEGDCTPSKPPMQATPKWATFGRSCKAVPRVPCNGGQGICLAASPPGYRVCIFRGGDNDCSGPEVAPYTEKHVFYEKYEDTRACSPCTCGTPSGGSCSSTISIYTDGACSTLAYSATVTAAGADCHDVPAGSALGSKSATTPTYAPGTCTPGGGEPMGAATPLTPSTYCCLPLP